VGKIQAMDRPSKCFTRCAKGDGELSENGEALPKVIMRECQRVNMSC